MAKPTADSADLAKRALLTQTLTGAGETAWFQAKGAFNIWITGDFTDATCSVEASKDGGTTPVRVPRDSTLAGIAADSTIGNVVVPLYEIEFGVLYRVKRTGAGTGAIKVEAVQ